MNRRYRKEKENILQGAKKLEKFRNFGKGYHISEDEYNYCMCILKQLNHVDNEEREILVDNFYKELENSNQMKLLASNQIVSRILDVTLPLTSVDRVVNLMKEFSEDLRLICLDPFASHVLQTLLVLGLKYLQHDIYQEPNTNEDGKKESNLVTDEENQNEIKAFIQKVSKFVYNNLDEFVYEIYASHVVRSVLEVCSGVDVSGVIESSPKHAIQEDQAQVLAAVPSDIGALLPDFATRLAQLPNFTDVIYDKCGSAVVQTALLAFSGAGYADQTATFISHIVDYGFKALPASLDEGSVIHPVFEWTPSCRLMEVCLSVATEEQHKNIFEDFFSANLSEVVKHKIGNFAVQKLLSAWKKKKTFKALYDAVSTSLNDALMAGNTGVLSALVQACRRLRSRQSKCYKRLFSLLGCSESESSKSEEFSALLSLIPLTQLEEMLRNGKVPPVSIDGSKILQELLQFKKPILLVNRLLEMKPAKLVFLACSPKGSRVVEVFAGSPSIGEESREKLVGRLQGHFAALACCPAGSWSLEALWGNVGIKTKTKICQELIANAARLKENKYGIIIYNKLQLRLFNEHEKEGWEELMRKERKRKQLLDGMLKESDEIAAQPPKKKKKKKNDWE